MPTPAGNFRTFSGDSYTVTPASQSAATGAATPAYTITLIDINNNPEAAPAGGQAFTLSDGGAGGVFSPAGSVTVLAGQSSATFTYRNGSAGTDALTVMPSGGALAGLSGLVVQAVISNSGTGGGPTLSAFLATPPLLSATIGAATGLYTVSLLDGSGAAIVAPSGGQAFLLSDGGAGGVFNPASLTIAAGSSSGAFSYSNPAPGRYALGIAPSGGTLSGAGQQTVQAAVTPFASYTGPGSGSGGKTIMPPIITAAGVQWGAAYLFSTQNAPDDVSFAKLQSFSMKDGLSLKELMGPEGLTAQAVGASERKITADATVETVLLDRVYRLRGGSAPTTLTPIANPVGGPTLAAAAGTTALAAGFVGVAFSYVSQYGETLISPVVAVSVTAGQQIGVTALGGIPSGTASVNWYVTAGSFATAAAAQAAPVTLLTNNTGTAFNIIAYPAAGAKSNPLTSNLPLTRRIYTATMTDEPIPFKLHFTNPIDGSGREAFFYQVICPDISYDMKLRDFSSEKLTFNIYADPATGKIFDLIGP